MLHLGNTGNKIHFVLDSSKYIHTGEFDWGSAKGICIEIYRGYSGIKIELYYVLPKY